MQTNAVAVLTTPANAGAPEAEKTSSPAGHESVRAATGSNKEAKPITPVVEAANSPCTLRIFGGNPRRHTTER